MNGTGHSKLLLGAYDCHVHAAPDVVPRAQDWLQLGEAARAAGLAGLVLKDHTGSTAGQAQLLNRVFPDGPRFFGSLTLNPPVGGLNPHAVAAALRLGAAVVFFPTYAANYQIERMGVNGFPEPFPWARTAAAGLGVLDRAGELRPDVLDILRLIAQHDAVLATGHLSPPETLALLDRAAREGVRRMIVTHASEPVPNMSVEDQQRAVQQGALIEHCLMALTDSCGRFISAPEMIQQILHVGIEHIVLSSDFGQSANGPPLAACTRHLHDLVDHGLDPADIQTMLTTNPARLLAGANNLQI
jgi:hypothetical protein